MKLQIKINGKSYVAEVEVLEDSGGESFDGSASASVQGIPAPGAYTPGHAAELHSANEKQYRSSVSGVVIKVNVVPGQQVEPNNVLVVLEAMKMELNICAHHAGRVKSVNVAQGNSVKSHQLLVELE